MCWFAYNEETGYKRTLIAKRDIEVFKICQNEHGYVLPYFKKDSGVVYGEIGINDEFRPSLDVFESEMTFTIAFNARACDIALHSYLAKKCKVVDERDLYIVCCDLPENKVYENELYKKYDTIRLNCVIPKGAKYRINKYGECVSNKLVVKSFEYID